MSITENPLVGRAKGSMANFTMYTSHGKNIVRGKAFEIKDAKSKDQLIMRDRMKLLADRYQIFKSIIRLGFPERREDQIPHNMFISANFSRAFEMIDEIQVIRNPLLLLSKGSLPEVKVMNVVTGTDGITIRYNAKEMFPDVQDDDEIIACALLNSGGLYIAKQFIGYEDIGTILLKHNDLETDKVECCYVFVRSGDGKKASDSVYVEVEGSTQSANESD